jgi:hypothetical protein
MREGSLIVALWFSHDRGCRWGRESVLGPAIDDMMGELKGASGVDFR